MAKAKRRLGRAGRDHVLITAKIRRPVVAALRAISRARDVTVTSIVERAVDDWLTRQARRHEASA